LQLVQYTRNAIDGICGIGKVVFFSEDNVIWLLIEEIGAGEQTAAGTETEDEFIEFSIHNSYFLILNS
jgi:hypothetical protein